MLDDFPRPYVPPGNLEANTLFGFLKDDFASVWNGVGATGEAPETGANFALGLLATVLIELCSRIAASNDHAYNTFSEALGEEDPRYYAVLPFEVNLPRRFRLPASPSTSPNRQLLALIFDLLRNGQAHQYQQMVGTLSDGRTLSLQLTGVAPGQQDGAYQELMRWPRERPADHLALDVKANGDIWLRVRPEVLFKDVQRAAERSGLFNGMLQLDYLVGPAYAVSSLDVLTALERAGCARISGAAEETLH